jgi:hypothetical protein
MTINKKGDNAFGHAIPPGNFFVPIKGKLTTAELQEKFLNYLKTRMSTARMIEIALKMECHDVTRLKTMFLKTGQVINLSKSPCKVTGRSVWWFTADPELLAIKQTASPKYCRTI